MSDLSVIKQHLIDPEICIRCNTCEATCPVGAITHDDRNYVVDADKCESCMACIAPCPTGSIDNWRTVPRARAYAVADQLGWDELPAELDELPAEVAEPVSGNAAPAVRVAPATVAAGGASAVNSADCNATLPPWSAAHAYTNLYGPQAPQRSIVATVTGNVRVTAVGREYDTHHIVLDFGAVPLPLLEGQSIGILPPGFDGSGRAHHARQYSVASPRNGERPGYNNTSLTVKRVLEDHQGRPVRGVASNFLCDLVVGDKVQVIGPFGTSFLMPNHPRSHVVMICTGTGSAPMRAMTEWRRRLRHAAAGPSQGGAASSGGSAGEAAAWGQGSRKFEGGKLLLFFGARTQEELPYFGPLQNLPRDFIDINFAYSRTPGAPKRYVQDLMRDRSADLAPLLTDPDACFYVCGLKAMEQGVVQALRDVAQGAGLSWTEIAAALKAQGRLHLETY